MSNLIQSAGEIIVQRPPFVDLGPKTFAEAQAFSTYLARSELVPKDYRDKPQNCLIAIMWGAEIGLGPLQAIQNIATINGRPSLYGDAMIALVRGSGFLDYIKEDDDGEIATCRVKRRNEEEVVRTFSNADAKLSGLWGKQGPWTQYPKRMRQMRARGFAMRDVFADVLRGLRIREEAQDMVEDDQELQLAERVDSPEQVAKPATKPDLPPYPDDRFAGNLQQWVDAIMSGKATITSMLTKISTKFKLSLKQIAELDAAVTAAQKASWAPKQQAEYADVERIIRACETSEDLAKAAELIKSVADDVDRTKLVEVFGEVETTIAPF